MTYKVGMLVKAGGTIPITTVNREGRQYFREKSLKRGKFLFGTVESVITVERELTKPVKIPSLLNDEGEVVVDDDGHIVTEVVKPAKIVVLVRWAGRRYRTSILPVEMLIPRNQPV